MQRSQADTELHSSVGQPVEGPHPGGEIPWLHAGDRSEHGAEADALRLECGRSECDPRVDAPHRFGHEDPVPAVPLRKGGDLRRFRSIEKRDDYSAADGPG